MQVGRVLSCLNFVLNYDVFRKYGRASIISVNIFCFIVGTMAIPKQDQEIVNLKINLDIIHNNRFSKS